MATLFWFFFLFLNYYYYYYYYYYLEYSCFLVLLVSTIQENESAVQIHISLPFGLPSCLCRHSALSRVFCALHYILIIIYFIHSISSVYVSLIFQFQ